MFLDADGRLTETGLICAGFDILTASYKKNKTLFSAPEKYGTMSI